MEFQQLKRDQFPVENVTNLPEASGQTSAGFGLMGLMNSAPHPNTAKAFVNWLATKDGMETPFTITLTCDLPERFRYDVETGPQKAQMTVIILKDRGYHVNGGMTQELPPSLAQSPPLRKHRWPKRPPPKRELRDQRFVGDA